MGWKDRLKFRKRTWIIIGVVALLIVGSMVRSAYQRTQAEKEAQEQMIYTVKSGDIDVEVKVTATASLVNEQNLSFGQQGKIAKVNVSIGNEVKAGDVLAELSMSDYENTLQTAELELENARLGLTKLLNDDTSLRESQLQSQLNEARSSYAVELEQLDILRRQLDTVMTQKEDQLAQWRNDYELSQKGLAVAGSGLTVGIKAETEQTQGSLQSRAQTMKSIQGTLRMQLGELESAVRSVDKIFCATDLFKSQGVACAEGISLGDSGLRRETETLIRESNLLLGKMGTQIENIKESISDDEIYDLIDRLYVDSEVLVRMTDKALTVLDRASVSNMQSELQGYVAAVNAARGTVVGARSQLQTLASSVNSMLSADVQQGQLQVSVDEQQLAYDRQGLSLQKQESDIRLLEKEIGNLQADHANQVSRKQAQIVTLQERVDVLQKELNDLRDGPDAYDIQQQENLVRQAELRVERARDQQDDYQIIAEFDGRVRTVDIVEGEQYELEDRKFIVVENPNLVELKLQVSQIDIVKIQEGAPVIVTFDAYPYRPIQAEVSSRNVNPQPNGRGGVYYEAVVLLEKQDDLEILAGMSALVTIVADQAKSALLVPVLALTQEDDKRFVYLKDGDEYELQQVEVGVMNNFQAEIRRGVREGDQIKASILDDDILQEMGIDDSSFSPFGG